MQNFLNGDIIKNVETGNRYYVISQTDEHYSCRGIDVEVFPCIFKDSDEINEYVLIDRK